MNAPLTARSVNEFVYCPRLFWLEEVAGVFIDNEHTVEGRAVHRRVDKPGGTIPAPGEGEEDAPPPWNSRSLWLGDESLGVSGKLDLVEVDGPDGAVMPVDTKKGRPDHDGAMWPADEVQLTLQALLLRAQGYRVDRVAVWYRSARRRVVADLTPERIERARTALAGARACRDSTQAPPPLVDSPKCAGCSLNLVCLPDETHRLMQSTLEASGDDMEIRRVVPARDDAIPLYVTGYGLKIGLEAGCLRVRGKADGADIDLSVGLPQVSQLNIVGTARMSTPAMHACLREGVPVCWFSGGGYFLGRTQSSEQRWVGVRMAQFAAWDTPRALEVARVLIADKIANGRTLLRRNHPSGSEQRWNARMKRLVRLSSEAADSGGLLAREGEAAKLYWDAFGALLAERDQALTMQGRNRRPPRDPVNAMLGFAYALLVKDSTLAVAASGLDPFLGVYHAPHHGRASMALDLMEPFRPLVADSVVHAVVKRGEIGSRDFIVSGQAVAMKARARKTLISAYERRMDELITHPLFGYRISYRQVLGVQARLLARALTGEVPAMPSFRVR